MEFRKKTKKDKKRILKKGWFLRFLPIELFNSLKHQQLISPGVSLIIIILLLPLYLWLRNDPDSIKDPIIALAKFNAFMAITTLSLNFILSTRLKILEFLFGGLDRMISVHKLIGRFSFLFIVLHPIFLIVFSYPNFEIILNYVLPIGPLEIAAGVLSVYIFIFLITLTVAIHIPYHYWHNSHKLLGFVLIGATFHAVYSGSDINNFPMLRYYIIVLSGIGQICWLYMLLFYKHIGPKYKVRLTKVIKQNDVTELYFPKPKKFDYEPGQFVFIRFPKFKGFKELFPFSISTDPSKDHMRLSIKKSGDFTTQNIPRLQKGDKAIIMGPYGKFGEPYLNHEKNMIWIAGGIGITPFLSLAKHESLFPTGRKIHLIWVIRNKDEAFHDSELKEEASRNQHFSYIHWFSDEKGRITSEDIVRLVGGKHELKNRMIFMCAPPKMMYGLSKGLHKKGIHYRQIIFEDFNMLD